MFQLLELLALASDLYRDIPGQRFVLGGILQAHKCGNHL